MMSRSINRVVLPVSLSWCDLLLLASSVSQRSSRSVVEVSVVEVLVVIEVAVVAVVVVTVLVLEVGASRLEL